MPHTAVETAAVDSAPVDRRIVLDLVEFVLEAFDPLGVKRARRETKVRKLDVTTTVNEEVLRATG